MLALAAFPLALNNNLVGPLLPFFEPAIVPDADAKGQLFASAGIAAAISSLLLGPWIDRQGRRRPMVLGLILFAAASVAHLLATTHMHLLALRLVAGFGAGLAFTAASVTVADLVPYARRGTAMGIFSIGILLTMPVGLPVAQWIAATLDWRWAFAGIGLLAIGAALLFPITLPPDPPVHGRGVPYLRVLRTRGVVAALLSIMCHVGGFFTVVQFTGPWLDASGHLARDQQWPIWLGLGICAAVGSALLPRYADRYGKLPFILATTAVVSIGLLVLGRWLSFELLVWVGIPIAIFASARIGPAQALLSELVPAGQRGTIMGIRAAAVSFGMGVFGWLGARLNGELGFDALLVGGGLMLALAFLLLRIGVPRNL